MLLKIIGCTHGFLPNPDEFEGSDCIIITGDLGKASHEYHNNGEKWLLSTFDEWLKSLPLEKERILGIFGNHDIAGEKNSELGYQLNWTYLQDKSYVLDGIKFWGSPWSVRFGDWAFMEEDWILDSFYDMIPQDTDVIISHGPPYGYGDLTPSGNKAGSKSLLSAVNDIRPKLVVNSHIHGGHGIYETKLGTKVANVSYLNEEYEPQYGVTTLEI